VINIHKTSVTEVTGIINGITEILQMIMDIIKTEITGIEEIWGEINIIIQVIIKEDLAIIHLGPGAENQGTIECIVMGIETNNPSYINPAIVGFFISCQFKRIYNEHAYPV
jgi:hypothetical protein